MSDRARTLEEIRRVGLAALAGALGPVDAIRFLQIFDNGSGNYTSERAHRLGDPSVADVVAEVKARRARKR